MKKVIDACGLTCPAPVLLVKETIEKEAPTQLSVLVSNDASKENVARFLGSKGYAVHIISEGEKFLLAASLDDELVAEMPALAMAEDEAVLKIVVLIMTDCMGSGDDLLGEKLMVNYIKTLKEMGPELWQIILVNGGVKLATKSSPVIEELQHYESSGITILACGTCLDFFNLLNQKEVGTTTNMLDIVTATQLADKVITLS